MATSQGIRNVCLLGHGGDGKTSLAESMLYLTKGTDRLGKTADGTTVCDYDPEEIKRQISISATPVPVEFNNAKINIMDTPGYFDFVGEVLQCLRVADAGLVVLNAKSGVGVGHREVGRDAFKAQAAQVFLRRQARRGERRLFPHLPESPRRLRRLALPARHSGARGRKARRHHRHRA